MPLPGPLTKGRVFFRPVARSARSLRVPVVRRAHLVARSALMACAAAPHERNTTGRAKCCMDATGLRRRLRRAGGLHGGTVSSGRRRHRRPARIARRRGHQRAAAPPARGSHRTQAGSPAGGGVTGAQLASHAGMVGGGRWRHRRAARVARRRGHRRRARVAAPANHARSRGLRYGGHSISSSWESMSKGVALGCFSGDLGLFHVEHRPRCATDGQVDPPGGAGASGALLRTPWAVRPLAACKVRALPWHGQAGGSGRGAGGAAARRGRIWGACRRGRALQKM